MKASQHARRTLALDSAAPSKVSYLRKSVESPRTFGSPLDFGSSICHRQTLSPRPLTHVTHVSYIMTPKINYYQFLSLHCGEPDEQLF